MKKIYTKPVVEVTDCELRMPLAASVSFQDGETTTMYAPGFDMVQIGWDD